MNPGPLEPISHQESSQKDFATCLAGWFANESRALPWRAHRSVYETWVSEVMSQQTTLAVVVPRFLEFIQTLPHVDRLAQAPEDTLRRLWAGLGYYSRARNLQKAAQFICSQGSFPTTYEGWLSLPGVGPYTAAMVSSLCFDAPVAAVDGNVIRVVSRLQAQDSGSVWTPQGQASIVSHVQSLLGPAQEVGVGSGLVNEALIELGATVCRKHTPLCSLCPVKHHCQAFQKQIVELCPPKKPRLAPIDVDLDVCIHVAPESREVALVQRAGPWLAKTLGFPIHESPTRPALGGPDLFGQPGPSVVPGGIGMFRHSITRHRIRAHVVPCKDSSPLGSVTWVPWEAVGTSVSSSLDKKAWLLFSQHVKNNPQIAHG